MSAPYTRRLGAVRLESLSVAAMFTAPGSYVTILRDLVICNFTSAAVDTFLSVKPVSGSAYYLLALKGMAAGTTSHLDLRQEMLPGEILQFQLAAGTGATCMATGYLLTNP